MRLVSPEIDKTTRLGRVRIFLGDDPRLRIGAFARGTIETAQSRAASACRSSAVVYDGDGADRAGRRATASSRRRAIKTGLTADGLVEVREGLAEGDLVVARAGTFLRDGDAVRPVVPDADKISGIQTDAPQHLRLVDPQSGAADRAVRGADAARR